MGNDTISLENIKDIILDSEKEKEATYLTVGSRKKYKLQNKMPNKIADVLLNEKQFDAELANISNILDELDPDS